MACALPYCGAATLFNQTRYSIATDCAYPDSNLFVRAHASSVPRNQGAGSIQGGGKIQRELPKVLLRLACQRIARVG